MVGGNGRLGNCAARNGRVEGDWEVVNWQLTIGDVNEKSRFVREGEGKDGNLVNWGVDAAVDEELEDKEVGSVNWGVDAAVDEELRLGDKEDESVNWRFDGVSIVDDLCSFSRSLSDNKFLCGDEQGVKRKEERSGVEGRTIVFLGFRPGLLSRSLPHLYKIFV